MCGDSGEKEMTLIPGTAKPRPETLGAWLEIQMKKSNLTEKKLARKAGIGESAVIKWVKDENPPKILGFIAVCEVFATLQDRTPSQLLFEAIQHIPEMRYAEERCQKRRNRK